ncbi:MAG: hypothetical protein RMM29_07785 [Planctomycetota bacterium]|nr:hypothetical protein [Planctomycetota bacterium]MCX8039168.1 hypothetical protein [Planctomycetota bacterium]MDW8373529.1 hypothetical protein [Planctomycetota bacterium]
MPSPSVEQTIADGVQRVQMQARTVTAQNLQGTVKVITVQELQALLGAAALQHAGIKSEEVERRERELIAKHAEALQAHEAKIAELKQRIAELEAARRADLEAAEQAKQAAVEAAQAAAAQRIAELEAIIARDDSRQRVALLEAEIERLRALIDRYETGLEVVTAISQPHISEDLALCERLAGQCGPQLAKRLTAIKVALQAASTALEDGLQLINEQRKGSLYGVIDLVEHAVRLEHLHAELLSIEQALQRA